MVVSHSAALDAAQQKIAAWRTDVWSPSHSTRRKATSATCSTANSPTRPRPRSPSSRRSRCQGQLRDSELPRDRAQPQGRHPALIRHARLGGRRIRLQTNRSWTNSRRPPKPTVGVPPRAPRERCARARPPRGHRETRRLASAPGRDQHRPQRRDGARPRLSFVRYENTKPTLRASPTYSSIARPATCASSASRSRTTAA